MDQIWVYLVLLVLALVGGIALVVGRGRRPRDLGSTTTLEPPRTVTPPDDDAAGDEVLVQPWGRAS